MPDKLSTSITKNIVGVALAVVLAAAVGSAGTESGASEILVRTRQGTIQGLVADKVEQFRGVPYAAPPLAELRWRAPQPPQPHADNLNATAFPAPCIQGRPPAGFPAPNEDCLYLNLYRPVGSRDGKKMPVLVYIHGGGFTGGTASARTGIELAAGNDMIVIMINYRLGALGWLGLSELDAETANGASSGNYGLLDMVASLRWIQENVAAFGGDRENVTIAGTSAGGIGICALMTAGLHEPQSLRAVSAPAPPALSLVIRRRFSRVPSLPPKPAAPSRRCSRRACDQSRHQLF
jgi:para-nitrobenzyl esterase